MKRLLIFIACSIKILFASDVSQHWHQELYDAKQTAIDAGKILLELRESGQLQISKDILENGQRKYRSDADKAASQYISSQLLKKYPSYGMLSHDQLSQDPSWHQKHYVWIVQPIDGSREFVKGSDEFHIQIGLLAGHESVVGVSYYPSLNQCIWAVQGGGAWIEKNGVARQLIASPNAEKVLIQSSSLLTIQSLLKWKPSQVLDQCFNSTTRLLYLIDGKASLYISLGASPKAKKLKGSVCNYGANVVIAKESGLLLSGLDGRPLCLRNRDALLTQGVVLTNDMQVYSAVLESDWGLKR